MKYLYKQTEIVVESDVTLDPTMFQLVEEEAKGEPEKKPVKKKSNETIAKEVLAGKWGSGKERKKKLKAAGYNYAAIQKIVNKICKK